jgi:predicted nucleic acid-binding protein
MNNKKIFVDSDIVLDVLSEREPFYDSSAEIFDLGYEKVIELYTTPVVLANVFYILRKKYGIEKSKEYLIKLRLIMKILSIEEKMVDNSLNSKFGDFEDGLQYFTAKEHKIPVIITRNTKDYVEKDVIVQTPDEYIRVNKNMREY